MKTVMHITKPTFSHVKQFIKEWKLKPKDIINIYQTDFNGDYNIIFWIKENEK